MLDKLLEKTGLRFEDLNTEEKQTILTWTDTIQKGAMSMDKIKEYIISMREAVETELSKADNNTKQDIFLKARLRNYLLLEALMTSPDKAKEQLENMISGLVGKK
jgi:hypothetical protein